jgi:uncharacterized protein (DUF362 family)
MREDGPMKRYFSVVDGIDVMEGNGPVAGTRRVCGGLLAGADPVAGVGVCARGMGLGPARLPVVARAWGADRYPLVEGTEADIAPRSNVAHWNRPLHEWRSEQSMRFKPHFGWTGRIEWDGDSAAGD